MHAESPPGLACERNSGKDDCMNEAFPFDEMRTTDGSVRPTFSALAHWLEALPETHIASRRAEAEAFFRRIGITFAVYGDEEGAERLIPFDILPRILSKREWLKLRAGLEQRVTAINAFIADVYGAREIVRAGIVPEELLLANPAFCPEMTRIKPAGGIFAHISGIDLVRTGPDAFVVLEDNVRTPSGVSYMMENREAMLRLFPELFSAMRIEPVDQYPEELVATLRSVAPLSAAREPNVVVLTPGPHNSAYYEHSFLADRMGVELVEGLDLFVRGNVVFMRTTEGPVRVDVIYRRIDDAYLDPLAFRPDSTLGVPGLVSAYKAGNVTLANAIGTGIADDKAICSFMPEIIRFYSGSAPLLDNVPTFRCREAEAHAYVLANLKELVVKEVNGSGGYGMLVGPHATSAERAEFAARIRANPANYIAQPTLALSTVPCFVEEGLAPRHVDLRPFVLLGADRVRIVPGGLTRVALKKGSLIVNSSQGGGTKDTWILEDTPEGG
jgi:uncharacterized circularly permuted ATP-grasp superfamily protein